MRRQWQGDLAVFQRAAVEQDGRAVGATGTGEPFHQAAVDPDVDVLGALAYPRQLKRRDAATGQIGQRPGGRQLQSRRG